MASQMPKTYYGLHFMEGVAEYSSPEDRIFISESTAKQMDSTFQGIPVYVGHVDKVNLEKLQEEADGYVVESFYNPKDGKHWAKFVVVSDRGHEAIANGWRLSNAYSIVKSAEGGRWHNVEYNTEVIEGRYTHLAIVQVPRYDESIILTPEQFKEYNEKKENELKQLTNSIEKKGSKFMFNFFKKDKIENSQEIADTTVILKNGQEMSVGALVDLVNKQNEDEKAKEELEKKNAEEEAKKKEEEEKKNAEMEEEEKKKKALENSDDEDEGDKEDKKNEIKNAMENVIVNSEIVVETQFNKVARGKSLYGSN